MNLNEDKYSQFGLVRDMLAAVDVINTFDTNQAIEAAVAIRNVGRLMLTGEGSSRLFPAKHAIHLAGLRGWNLQLATESARQLAEYDLTDWSVFAASNSGRTSEPIRLFQKLADTKHPQRYSLTANAHSKLETLSTKAYVLACGPENAVAATKSVIAQALFYQAILEHTMGHARLKAQLGALAGQVQQALTARIAPDLIDTIRNAKTIYFSGRNNGVAEELTLKTNEITRKKADFLEGTFAVHGIEEVMEADDVVIVIDPYPDYEPKFQDVLVDRIGLAVIAIADRQTSFPTILIPRSELPGYVQMAAGWNLLVEVGLAMGVDLDHPVRARKVGNEFVAG